MPLTASLLWPRPSESRSGEDKPLGYGSFLFLFVTDATVKEKNTGGNFGVAIATMRDVSTHKRRRRWHDKRSGHGVATFFATLRRYGN